MNITLPTFSGYFFVESSNFDALELGREYGAPIATYSFQKDEKQLVGIYTQPEHDELVLSAIAKGENTRLFLQESEENAMVSEHPDIEKQETNDLETWTKRQVFQGINKKVAEIFLGTKD